LDPLFARLSLLRLRCHRPPLCNQSVAPDRLRQLSPAAFPRSAVGIRPGRDWNTRPGRQNYDGECVMPLFGHLLPVVADAHLATPAAATRPIPLYDPGGLMDQLNRPFRRRLGDRVEDLFQDACITADLDTAEKLLAVLENMQERQTASGENRRVGDGTFAAAREELALRKKAAERKVLMGIGLLSSRHT
jgi:hypothetical protein